MTAACKPRQLHQLSRVALLVSAALAMTACVDERAFFITGNASECVESQSSDSNLASGILDVTVGEGYEFYPELRSDLVESEAEDGEPERNILIIKGFEVDLDLPDNFGGVDSALTKTFTYASGMLEPAGGTVSFSRIPIISRELVAQLSFPDTVEPVIVASIRAVASHNGSTLKSVEYKYPIKLCRGCLVADLGDCPSTKPEGVFTTNDCGMPQDSPVVCCTQAASGNKVCLDTQQLDGLPEETATP